MAVGICTSECRDPVFVEPARAWPDDKVISDPAVVERVAKYLDEYLDEARDRLERTKAEIEYYERVRRTPERSVLVMRRIVGGRSP